jgi:hypothetical protein
MRWSPVITWILVGAQIMRDAVGSKRGPKGAVRAEGLGLPGPWRMVGQQRWRSIMRRDSFGAGWEVTRRWLRGRGKEPVAGRKTARR